jgi:hypothetical protein
MCLDREDRHEKTCSTRYGNAMKGHTPVPFRSFRALINLSNFVLRQVTLIMVRGETHQTLAQRKCRLQLISITSFPATKVMRVLFRYEIGQLYLIGT